MTAKQEHFRSALESAISDFHLPPLSQEQCEALVAHYRLMVEWNERMNLTRIIEPEQAARFHYAESLFGARFVEPATTILDVGSGAGFPGLPMAVCLEEKIVTALESNQKKSLFLLEAKTRLNLQNFSVVSMRLEQYDWTDVDLLVCRALDRAEKMLPKVIKKLSAKQRLMIYCAAELADKVRTLHERFQIHSIPQATNRFVVVVG